MKKVINMVVAAAMLAGATVTLAEDAALDFSAGADYLSKYIWRGQNLSDDPVFQPSASVAYGPLTAAFWGNMDTTNINGNSGDFSEFDTSIDYTSVLPGVEGVTYSLGLIYYDFPGASLKDTTEVNGGLAFDLPLSPFVKIYRDIDEFRGTYYQVGIGRTFEKVRKWSESCYCDLALGACVGYANTAYNKAYWGVKKTAGNDLTLTAALPICLGDWTITPKMGYSTLLSGDIGDSDAYGTSSDNFFAGIGASIGL